MLHWWCKIAVLKMIIPNILDCVVVFSYERIFMYLFPFMVGPRTVWTPLVHRAKRSIHGWPNIISELCSDLVIPPLKMLYKLYYVTVVNKTETDSSFNHDQQEVTVWAQLPSYKFGCDKCGCRIKRAFLNENNCQQQMTALI